MAHVSAEPLKWYLDLGAGATLKLIDPRSSISAKDSQYIVRNTQNLRVPRFSKISAVFQGKKGRLFEHVTKARTLCVDQTSLLSECALCSLFSDFFFRCSERIAQTTSVERWHTIRYHTRLRDCMGRGAR